MFYIVYKTTNILNGKYYIGHHRAKTLCDGYLGSGPALLSAIKKYGRSNFKRENLYVFSDEETMLLCEIEIIDFFIDDEDCYNMKRGGKGGWDHVNAMNIPNCMKDPEIVAKVVASSRKNGSYTSAKRLSHLKRMTEISVKNNTGKKREEHSLFMKENYDRIYNNPETKKKVKDSLSATYRIEKPDGTVIITNRLSDFCKENGLGFKSVWLMAKYNKVKKQGKLKGWKATYVKVDDESTESK